MVECLVRNGADVHFTTSNGDTLLQTARTLRVEPASQRLIEIIDASRDAKRAYASLEDETPTPVAKRQRFTSVNSSGERPDLLLSSRVFTYAVHTLISIFE
ncbi:hypothetical protein JVU11DRAFT_8554 [Chiua virens]|nr:hypothetical protein JVU11DRAFT_8554 [Chiua virens]